MDTPTSCADFVETQAYKDGLGRMNDADVAVVVFTGAAGCGKSTVAMQMCENIYLSRKDTLFLQVDCTNLVDLYSNLTLFYTDMGLNQNKLSPPHPKKWDILQSLFWDLNTSHPDHFKLIILNNAEAIEDVLNILNHICKVIARAQNLKDRWKILLTSQKHPAQTVAYANIGSENFIKVHSFTFEEAKKFFERCGLSDALVKIVTDKLGSFPLILKICQSYLLSHQAEDMSQCVHNLIKDIETQTQVLTANNQGDPMNAALTSIKISIDRLLNELPLRQQCLQIIQTLTLFNAKNITIELLVACAETYIENPEQASSVAKNLIQKLIERDTCTKRQESKVTLFNFHLFVQRSMKLFVDEEERLSLVENALIALTRVMPKDGRKHQTRLVSFYSDHGKSLDSAMKAIRPSEIKEKAPIILLLHCSMLTSMGYCHLAQRSNDYKEAVKLLKSALNKYCELVLQCDYDSLLPPEERRQDPALVELNVAKKLYEASKILTLIDSQSYQQYITDLPLYHRLTKKDLANMVDDPSAIDLVNSHLTRDDLEKLEQGGKVLPADVLRKLYIAEVLAQIYSVWSTIHRKRADYDAARDECIIQAEAAVEIYKRIFLDYKVYLLAGLITERDMLSAKLQAARTLNKVKEMTSRLEVLSKVGKNPEKRKAYEAGLMRSDLSKDKYHELLCKESAINGLGRLYEITRINDFYDRGRQLFMEVENIARTQLSRHNTLSYSHRNFALFLFNCKKYGEAVIHILRAMLELHRSLRNGDTSPGHPEFSHPRFKALYSCLVRYYDNFSATRDDEMKERGDINVREEEKLLDEDMPECEYLTSAMKCWKKLALTTGGRLPSSVQPVAQETSQPSESHNELQYMETVMERELRELATAVAVSAQGS